MKSPPLTLILRTLLLAVSLPVLVAAQTRQWTAQPGTATADMAAGVAADSDYVYVVGATDGTIGRNSQGRRDAFLIQYDRNNGAQIWAEQIGTADYDAATAVTLDQAGNVYVAGSTTGMMVPGNHYGATDVWVAKYTSNGQQIWLTQMGSSAEDFATTITVDQMDHIIVAGSTTGDMMRGNQGGDDAWIAELDRNGNQLWLQQLGTSANETAFAVTTQGSGDVYVAGMTKGALVGSNFGGADVFLARFDSVGNQIWLRQFGTTSNDVARGIASDSAGHILLAGETDGALSGPSAGGSDAFLAQYDTSGAQGWLRQFGTAGDDSANAVAVDHLDHIYVAGNTDGSLGDVNQGLTDSWAARYDPQGIRMWVHQTGTAAEDTISGVAVNANCEVSLAGTTRGSLGDSNSGVEDAYVLQYSQSPTIGSFVPNSGAAGASIVIRGGNYYGVTSVSFNNAPAIFTVNSPTQITATLPAPASTGRIRVTTPCGTATSATDFTVTTPPSVALAVTPTTRTITAGQTTSYTITLSRTNYPGQVTFSASGQPPGANVSFNASPTTHTTVTMTVSTLISSASGTYTLTINATAPGIRIVPITVTLRINSVGVMLSATPTSRTVNVGQLTTYTININRTNYTGAVNLSAGLLLPAGITMSFNPPSTMGNSSTLTVTTTPNVTPATYTLNVIGTVPGLTIAPINVTLIINPAPRVTLSSTPTSRTIHECGTATYQLALSRVNFSGAVSLSVSGLPAGAIASFNPASTSGNSSTLTVYVTDRTAQGSWTLTISGVGANVSISPINVTLTTYSFDWLSLAGSVSGDVARSLAVDNSGSVYVVGVTVGDFDNAGAQTSAGGEDAWLARYSTSGTLQWVRQFGTTDDERAEAVAVDGSGDIYVGGWTCGDITTGGPGTGACGAFIAKYNSAGTRLWIAQFDTWRFDSRLSIAVNRITGDVYLTGNTQLDMNNAALGHTDSFLAKYNAQGTPQWTTRWGGAWGYDFDNGVAVDDAGNIFVTGEVSNDFPDYFPSVFLRKFDSSGSLQWSVQLDTSGQDYATSVAVNGSDVYVTGYTTGDLDGSGPGNYGSLDAFLAKYNGATGTLQWTRQLGTAYDDLSMGVSLDSSGNIYIVGNTVGDLDGPGPITNRGRHDLFIAMYDAAGTLQWTRQLGSDEDDWTDGGVAAGSSAIYVAGGTYGYLDGAGTGIIPGLEDAWVGRFTTPVAVGPSINSFTPTSGLPGTSVTITGSNFNGVQSVRFNGLPAVFTVNSSTQITATVPSGATNGRITVMTACGMATSTTDFVVQNIPQ